MDEVYKNLRFCISEKPIDVKYIYQEVLHKVGNVVIIHGNDGLLSRRTLCGHLDVRFRFGITFDYVISLIYFFSIDGGEYFLDLDDLKCTDILF